MKPRSDLARLPAWASLAWLAGGAVGCGEPPPPAVPTVGDETPDTAPRREPVVIALVIDQLASWVAEERFSLLPEDGGFARLRREGVYAPQMRFSHAYNATATGHASLFTGAPPRATGITYNGFMDEKTDQFISVLDDAKTQVVGRDGPTKQSSYSSAALGAPTVADALRAQRPEAVIVSLSLKDRGAIFAGGRQPDAALWFDTSLDQMVTSTAFSHELPRWATELVTPDYLTELRSSPWVASQAEWTAKHATEDANPGEGDYQGLGTTFPHDIQGAKKPAKAFRATPRGDTLLFSLAQAALEHHGDHRPLLLSLSLSSHDYVGHMFGPHSWEMWEELAALDRALADFLDHLEQRYGPDGFAVVLSSDHGVSPTPEAWTGRAKRDCRGERDEWQRPCGAIVRLMPDELKKEARGMAQEVMGPGEWVGVVANPFLMLTDAARSLPGKKRAELVVAISDRLEAIDGIEKVYDTTFLPERCPSIEDESVDALVCRSVAPNQGGDLYMLVEPGYYLDVGYTAGHGANHGSPYLYDRAVPLFVRPAHPARSGQLMNAPVDFRAYAKTLSSLLGIDPPPAARGGRDLTEPE